MMGTNINRQFNNYPGYFSMVSGRQRRARCSSRAAGSELARPPRTQSRRRVAIVAARRVRSARRCAMARARRCRKAASRFVYDKSYPPGTTDYAPILRAVQATNPDLVYFCSYPPDTVGIVRSMNEMNFSARMIGGGAMVGLLRNPDQRCSLVR